MISGTQAVGKPEIFQMFSEGDPSGALPPIKPNSSSATTTSSRIKYSEAPSSPPRKLNKNGSMPPAIALAQFGRVLSPFEHDEIKQYSEIWFVGPKAGKLNAGDGKGKNFGYDDEKGRYKCIKYDHIGYRYEVLKGLGKGSFGDVVRAYDHKEKCSVALKIIRNEKRFHKQGRCEIKILDHLRKNDADGEYNVIHMKDHFIFRGHLCITFELAHCDLYTALKKDSFRGFSVPRVRGFAESMLKSLQLLKKLRIIHCDLKPENVLLQSAGSDEITVIDFGSSCFDDQRVHTYIQSRFYRSPEVILGLSYGCSIDMWSFGCILSELHTGQPIFPGHNEKEQLMYQMQVLGVPSMKLVKRGRRADNFFNPDGTPKHIVDRKGRTRPPGSRLLTNAIGSSDPLFADFISRCLTWDVEARMTPDEAMEHPFINETVSAAAEGRMTTALATPALSDPANAQENQPPGANGKDAQAAKKNRSTLGLNWSLKSRKNKA